MLAGPAEPPAKGRYAADSTETPRIDLAKVCRGPDAYLAAPDSQNDDREPFLAVVPLIERGWQLECPGGASSRSRRPTGSPGWSSPPGVWTRKPS
ncbi:hypothetical protein ABZS68_33685 [Streptomyces sp. NPDC005571]|uniref:hypothetical protein n=1 Tax=Streptomyces sp. NPDC005571 TaxID=3156888 RepID=UPI0033A9D8CB